MNYPLNKGPRLFLVDSLPIFPGTCSLYFLWNYFEIPIWCDFLWRLFRNGAFTIIIPKLWTPENNRNSKLECSETRCGHPRKLIEETREDSSRKLAEQVVEPTETRCGDPRKPYRLWQWDFKEKNCKNSLERDRHFSSPPGDSVKTSSTESQERGVFVYGMYLLLASRKP